MCIFLKNDTFKKFKILTMCQMITVENKKYEARKDYVSVYLFAKVFSNDKFSFMARDIDFDKPRWNSAGLP